jgi:tetratricopeptide (TPR) repeat protein
LDDLFEQLFEHVVSIVDSQMWVRCEGFDSRVVISRLMKISLPSLDQALTINPASSKTWYERGAALADAGNYIEALVNFNRALTLEPDDCAIWVFRSVVLVHLERYAEALVSCDRALALKPKDSEALLFRGVALQRLGRYQEAYGSYENALGRWQSPSGNWRQNLKKVWKSLTWDRIPSQNL